MKWARRALLVWVGQESDPTWGRPSGCSALQAGGPRYEFRPIRRIRIFKIGGLPHCGSQFPDLCEVMIVVLGDEVEQVRDAHRSVKARVKRRPAKIFGRLGFELLDECEPCAAKLAKDFRQRATIVLRLVRLLIF